MKTLDILNTFIDSELAARQAGDNNEWYVMNWFRLKTPLIAAAPRLLDSERLKTLYGLLLYKGLLKFDAAIAPNYTLWEEAYREQTPLMVRKPWTARSSITRLQGLCWFGFDHTLSIARNEGFDDYQLFRLALGTPCGTNMPDILKRAERLLPFANDERVIRRYSQALLALDFIYDDWYGVTNNDESYRWTNLQFFRILLLLHVSTLPHAKETLNAYRERLPTLPKMPEQLESIARCEAACKKLGA